jgi:hypothetical protein
MQWRIFANVEILMADLVVALMLRVTQRKVCNPSLRVTLLRVYSSIVFVCVAALAILDKLDEVDHPTLCWWLAERQLPNGGLNGRPEKLEDARLLLLPSFLLLIFIIGLLQLLGAFCLVYLGEDHMD